MEFIHANCGGDIRDRVCQGCGKKWGLAAYMSATDIRPKPVSREERLAKLAEKPPKPVTTYASWADNIPFVPVIAKLYPNWPRKWRILSFVIFYGIIITGIIYWIKTC